MTKETIDNLHAQTPLLPDIVNWLFVDLNSYFASVEQEINPKLRGKPIGVVPMMAETTCCIAASIEAKKYGVKTGTIVGDARKMCPGIQFIQASHRVYVDYHNQILEAVEKAHPITHVMSIDEVALKLQGRDQKLENALKLAGEIRENIFKVGSQLRCSIGISTNKFLSKVASDMQKPNGLTVITKKDLPQKLLSLKLRDFPGIGERMEMRLHKNGIFDVKTLLDKDRNTMRSIWGGVVGEYFYEWLRGEDQDSKRSLRPKTVGHSHVLAPELRNQNDAYGVLLKQIHKAATRLRKNKAWAQGIQIGVRYTDRTKWSDELKMHECQDTHTLIECFQTLWGRRDKKTPLKVSVTLFDLIYDDEKTISFLDNNKRISLSNAMDSLNLKYGKNLVYPAGMHQAKNSAPTRIAFSNIPDFSIEDEKED